LAQEALAQEADAHEALAQEALAQEADAHEALDHEAEAHEADAQEALAQEALLWATLAQLAASNTLPEPPLAETTYLLSAAFGLGGLVTATALPASMTPTPTEPGAASFAGLAVSMSAPLT
jgi:hypothetical protein